MNFFVPAASDSEEAERVYRAFARFNDAPVSGKRIRALTWQHNGTRMSCEVGQPLPAYYQTGSEPVLAIFDCDTLYKICTPNRGGLRGDAVYAGKNQESHALYFTAEA